MLLFYRLEEKKIPPPPKKKKLQEGGKHPFPVRPRAYMMLCNLCFFRFEGIFKASIYKVFKLWIGVGLIKQ